MLEGLGGPCWAREAGVAVGETRRAVAGSFARSCAVLGQHAVSGGTAEIARVAQKRAKAPTVIFIARKCQCSQRQAR